MNEEGWVMMAFLMGISRKGENSKKRTKFQNTQMTQICDCRLSILTADYKF